MARCSMLMRKLIKLLPGAAIIAFAFSFAFAAVVQSGAAEQNFAVFENGVIKVDCAIYDGDYTLGVINVKNGWVEALQFVTAANGRLTVVVDVGTIDAASCVVNIYNARGDVVLKLLVVIAPMPSAPPETPSPTPAASPGASATPAPSPSQSPAPTPGQSSTPMPEKTAAPGAGGSRNPSYTRPSPENVKFASEVDIWAQSNSGRHYIEFIIDGYDALAFNEKALKTLCESGRGLSVRKGIVTVVLPVEVLHELEICTAQYMEIMIIPTLIPYAHDFTYSVNKTLSGYSYNIGVYVDGEWRFSFSSPVTVKYDVSSFKLMPADTKKLTGIIFDDGGIPQLGGENVGSSFNIYTSRLGAIGVRVSDTFVRITVSVNSALINVNGAGVLMDAVPYIADGRVMVPVRFVAEALGAEVLWLEKEQSVLIKLDGRTLSLRIGEVFDGMDVPAVIVEGRTMVPLRFVSEQLGCNVIWNDAMKTAVIYR